MEKMPFPEKSFDAKLNQKLSESSAKGPWSYCMFMRNQVLLIRVELLWIFLGWQTVRLLNIGMLCKIFQKRQKTTILCFDQERGVIWSSSNSKRRKKGICAGTKLGLLIVKLAELHQTLHIDIHDGCRLCGINFVR